MPVNISLLPDEIIARGITGADWGKAPDAFWSGQEQAQKQQERNLFSGGLPRTPAGDIDYNRMAELLARVQGAGAIPTLTALRSADIQQRALTGLEQGGPGIFGPMGQAPQQQPLPPSIQRTVPSVPQQTSSLEPDTGSRTLRPDQPGNLGEVTGISVDSQPTAAPQATSFAPTATPDAGYPPGFRQFNPTAVTGPDIGSFTPDQPARMAQAQAQPQDVPPPPAQSPLPPGSPGFFSLQNAEAYEARARRGNYIATVLGVGNMPAGTAGPKQQSDQDYNTAKQIREQIGKREELTPEIKQYQLGRQPGETFPDYQARVKGQETLTVEDVKDFRKENQVIQAAGKNAFNGLQKAELAKNLTLDPNFYSGPLQPSVQTFRQFQAVFGGNPSSALPQEAFQKSVSDLLQEQIKSMGQSGVGRVLMSEVAIMRQAVSSLGITPQSNRALLEISSRVYKQQQAIADIASKIKAPPGQMSDALDTAVRAHMQRSPLFTPDELRNPTLLGAPDAPPQSAQWSPQQRRMWAQGIGLKPGDPIRFNGQIGAVP